IGGLAGVPPQVEEGSAIGQKLWMGVGKPGRWSHNGYRFPTARRNAENPRVAPADQNSIIRSPVSAGGVSHANADRRASGDRYFLELAGANHKPYPLPIRREERAHRTFS